MFYYTVLHQGQYEFTEKGSRFIGTIRPVKSEPEAKLFLDDMRKQYFGASHHVFAYHLLKQDIVRFSDDGEPQGTAGKPILDCIIGQELKNAAVIVTRYFGGTLLGTGGLTRAYGKAAKLAISATEVVKACQYQFLTLKIGYSLLGKLQYFLQQEQFTIWDTVYETEVVFHLYIEPSRLEAFYKSVMDISAGSAVTSLGQIYFGSIHKNQFIPLE